MVLDFEYGINTGNRFLDLVGHDEDPDEYIARQTQSEEKPKKSTKDSKTVSSATTKKTTNKPASATSTNVSSATTKTNKENVAEKSATNDQRKHQSNVFSDNNNQQTRIDSGRGGGRGSFRRGVGSAGHDRPPYEGRGRGGGHPRFQRHEGHYTPHEIGEGENNNQRFAGHHGRGRGGGGDRGHGGDRGYGRGRGGQRGVFYNRNFEGGRGRGRGGRGRGHFNNRSFDESSQQQPQQQQQQQQQQPSQPQPQQRTSESNEWQPSTDSNFDKTRSQSAKTDGQELDTDQSLQDRSFEPDGARRGGRGNYRGRTFRSNRNYGEDRQHQDDQEVSKEEYRHNRRQHDRQPRSYTSGVKATEKKDGEGARNWGNPAEIPDEEEIANELNETTDQAASAPKNWSDQVDEAEQKQITLEEYRKQLEEKKRAHQEKIPQFNRRTAGEGEDQKNWQFKHEYRKKNDNGESEEEEEGSGGEEDENEEDEGEQTSGKKKLITIPLRFKPIELPRGGPFGSRGGQRRGSSRFHDRPYRDDQQRSKSPNQQQSPMSPQTGEYQYDDQQRSYRGGSRQGSGRNEYRRSYGNSARGSRGGYNRSRGDPNTPDFANALDFPTLPKQ